VIAPKYGPPSGDDKTSIVFGVKHKIGALYDALSVFKADQINMTKIESRPLKEEQFKSMFFIDFKGHIDDENIQDVTEKSPGEIKWLGSYVSGEKDAL